MLPCLGSSVTVMNWCIWSSMALLGLLLGPKPGPNEPWDPYSDLHRNPGCICGYWPEKSRKGSDCCDIMLQQLLRKLICLYRPLILL